MAWYSCCSNPVFHAFHNIPGNFFQKWGESAWQDTLYEEGVGGGIPANHAPIPLSPSVNVVHYIWILRSGLF